MERRKDETIARIKIEDLPVIEDISPVEAKGIFGGHDPAGRAVVEVGRGEGGGLLVGGSSSGAGSPSGDGSPGGAGALDDIDLAALDDIDLVSAGFTPPSGYKLREPKGGY